MAIDVRSKGGLSGFVGVPVGGSFSMTQSWEITVSDDPDLLYDVEMHVDLVDGRYEVAELRLLRREGGPAVTTDGLRTIPVTRLMTAILMRGVLVLRWTTDPDSGESRGEPVGDWSDEMDLVAATYLLAHAVGESPTKAVAERLGIPHSTAAKKVMRARQQGLLRPTTPGRAGGS